MNNALLKLALFVVFLPLVGFGQSVNTISNEDLQPNTNYRWTADKIYLLDGLVYLKGTSQLEIEAGTVIKAKQHPSTGDLTSALIITKQARIYASGSNSKPIIFTTETDHPERDQHLPAADKGLWGGLVLLGESPITHNTRNDQSMQLETLPVHEEWAQFGGPNSSHDKGTLKYVSIRHAGASAIEGHPLAGLTLAGVGSATKLDFVEVFATEAKGISFYGGTAQVKHAAVSFAGKEAFAWCEGFRGKGQFWFGLQDPNTTSSMAEHLGNRFDPMYISKATVYNATFIGNGQSRSAALLNFGSGSGGIYANSIFTNFAGEGIALNPIENAAGVDNRLLLQEGILAFEKNLWWVAADQSRAVELNDILDPNTHEYSLFLAQNLHRQQNELSDPKLINYDLSIDGKLDPRPLDCTARLNLLPKPIEDQFFNTVNFKGAFPMENKLWLERWTALAQVGVISRQLLQLDAPNCDMSFLAGEQFIVDHLAIASEEKIRERINEYHQVAYMVNECYCGGQVPRLQLWETKVQTELSNCPIGSRDTTVIDTIGLIIGRNPTTLGIMSRMPRTLCRQDPVLNSSQSSIAIGILDSGIDFDHDFLHPFKNIGVSLSLEQDDCLDQVGVSFDYIMKTTRVQDKDGHGTHLAGTIVKDLPENLRPRFLNYKIYEKGAAANSLGTLFELACAIHQAIDQEAGVINLSLGYWTEKPSNVLYRALERASLAGIPVVISAGNNGLNIDEAYPSYIVTGGEASDPKEFLHRWPASFKYYESKDIRFPNLDNLFVVGSTDPSEADLAPYSNYGIETVDVATAGTIYSTFKDGGFETLTGTSMSAAVVTRLIAIAKSYQPELSFDEIRSCLTSAQATIPLPATQRGAIRGKLKLNAALACMGVDTLQLSTVSPERFTDEDPASIKYDSLMLLKNLVIQLEATEPGKIFNNVEIKVKASPSDEEGIYTFGGCAGTTYSWNTILADGSELPPGQYFVEISINGNRINRALPPFIKLDPRNRRR